MTTTGKGDIVIYKPESDQAIFITKSGVVFKTVSISNPTKFEHINIMKCKFIIQKTRFLFKLNG
jgi:hypothetical protein